MEMELPIQTWNKSIVGTTVAHLGDMHIKTIQIAWPPAKNLAKAREILEPMSEKQRSMVSVLIQEAIDKRLIKAADPSNKSKKFAEYMPIWA